MRDIKFVLTPTEIEIISDCLNMAYDEDMVDDVDALEDLCAAFNVLRTNRKHVKVAVDEDWNYDDEPADDAVDEDFEDTDGDDDVADFTDDDQDDVWDATDADDECDGHGNCGCGCNDDPDSFDDDTKPEPEDAWNANTPWSTE